MKLLGLIGGMSWENTIEYYRIINELIKDKMGKWNSANILLYSVNFEVVLKLQEANKWDELIRLIIDICRKLELAECKAIIICSNTMHKIADNIEKEISIPLINVIDETAKIIKAKGIEEIGLLGTKFTMEDGFYINKLNKKYQINAIIPEKKERDYIHNAIYQEFAKGNFHDSTKKRFLEIIEMLLKMGAKGIILGCTELPILIKASDVSVPLFDTLKIHLKAAVDFMLS
ncbi:MAG: aspartate/glutamate racemase family protein [Candidatus Thorarchaeota archaeon]